MKRCHYERVVEGPDALRLYLQEIAEFSQLTPEEERRLGERARQGDQNAFRKLIESNLRFVVSMAKKYARSGWPLHELINEGNMGLIEAASRFDPSRGVRFVTYASWWIRQAILAGLVHHAQVFSLPPKRKHAVHRFEVRVARLTQELGHRPTAEEISKELDMEEGRVRDLMEANPAEISLSVPLSASDKLRVEDSIEDEGVPLDELLISKSVQEQLHRILRQLDAKERVVIERRFGLDGNEPKTLAEIGIELDLSREQVRQIEERALAKLRRPQRVRQLLGHLN